MGKIIVIGSSNTDLITRVERFPQAGETVEGKHFMLAMGGKGANQALAAHKLGGKVKFITSMGDDLNGENALKYYQKEGLDVKSSLIIKGTPSGTATILVDDNGENCIVITPGANNGLSPEYVTERKEEIRSASLLLLQMEVPYESVIESCRIASEANTNIMLNVAPARSLAQEVIRFVDILVVNETEAEIVSGEKVIEVGEQAVVDKLLALGAKSVVLTLGSRGCIMKSESEHYAIPAFKVKPVDSTGAGDTFCGALAVGLNKGWGWKDALVFASAASAICVTRMGAQPSIPTEKEVEFFLKKYQSTSNSIH